VFTALKLSLGVLQAARASNDLHMDDVPDAADDNIGDGPEEVAGDVTSTVSDPHFVHGMVWHSLQHGGALLVRLISLLVNAPGALQAAIGLETQVDAVGDWLMLVLQSCRHRGVIEAAAGQLRQLCAALTANKTANGLETRPAAWLAGVLQQAGERISLSITRRGAGFPGLVAALTSTSACAATFAHLMTIAERPVAEDDPVFDLPQVC
jgi:hypothetical protein